MRDYQRELDALRERIAALREHAAMLNQLENQKCRCEGRIAALQEQWRKEQRDVERLERVSLASVLSALRGSKDEDMNREAAEARAAKLRLQEEERQLEEIRAEIDWRRERIRMDADCENQYKALLREKEAEYRAKDPVLAARLTELEGQELELTAQQRELTEAVDAGNRVLHRLDAAVAKLEDAEGWSTWDMLGGGLIADAMKYSSMDEAQRLMEDVQSDLRRYQAELADVAQTVEVNLQQDGFTWAFDVFFDNFFADWAVRDQINNSRGEMVDVESRVRGVQYKLEQELRDVERQLTALRAEREEAVRQA